jgi:hypothetical protein
VTVALTRAGAAFLQADPVRALAKAIDKTGAGARLADGLEAGLRATLAERGGRAFGACHTCRHFRRDQRTGSSPHHCALLDEPLGKADSSMICVEQTV